MNASPEEESEAEELATSDTGTIFVSNQAKVTIPRKQRRQRLVDASELTIEIEATFLQDFPDEIVAGITLEDINGKTVFATTSEQQKNHPLRKGAKAGQNIKATYAVTNVFPEGTYFVDFALVDKYRSQVLCRADRLLKISLEQTDQKTGWLVRAPVKQEYEVNS
jgi:hypothetical protein